MLTYRQSSENIAINQLLGIVISSLMPSNVTRNAKINYHKVFFTDQPEYHLF